MNGSSEKVLVYDIGGSHISAGLCSIESLSLANVAKVPVSDGITSQKFLELLHDLSIQVNPGGDPIAGASLAFPGPFDYSSGISHMRHKLGSIFGIDLRSSLAAQLGLNPTRIYFLNDAEAYLLGEMGAGAARGVSRVIGITLGTGIGSGFAVNGQLVTEGPGVPPGGEIWNVPYANGIVEDLLSTHALQKDYEARTGKHLSVLEIAQAAKSDANASSVFEDFGSRLGNAIRDTMGLFKPEIIVLGGGISRSSELFLNVAQSKVAELGIRLVTSTLMENAPLAGAGAFWRESCRRQASVPASSIAAS